MTKHENMPYVKLDTGILDSTIWMDPDACKLFITALCLARLHELREPTPTYETFTNDLAAFVIPPGWYGFVGAAGPGLVRRSMLEPEAGMQALNRLSLPDHGSRSPGYDGRRLLRIERGFIVLNYVSYRDIDYSAAERQARFREREKERRTARNATEGNASNGVTITPVTHASSNSSSNSNTKEVKKIPSESLLGGRVAPSHAMPEFETLKSLYPKRAGDQRWPAAAKACTARMREGHTWQEIIDGVTRYAEYVRATGKTGTEYVQQAATFLGPNKGFAQPWGKPASAQATKLESVKTHAFASFTNVMAKLEAQANESN